MALRAGAKLSGALSLSRGDCDSSVPKYRDTVGTSESCQPLRIASCPAVVRTCVDGPVALLSRRDLTHLAVREGDRFVARGGCFEYLLARVSLLWLDRLVPV